MYEVEKFASGVAEKINYYVYRLIDPRNGQTFYVGKGKDNRVFDHVRKALDSDEDDHSLKLQTIRNIHSEGLEVVHVIHRHGMSEETALEVEAALIDAYAGLTNIQGGLGSADRGPMNAKQINRIYAPQELSQNEMADAHCVIIKINPETVLSNDGDIYKTVRYAWRIGQPRLEKLQQTPDHLVLAVIDGIVRDVYQNVSWKQVTEGNDKGRYEFDADPKKTNDNIKSRFIGKRINSYYRRQGLADPFLLTW